MLQLSLRLELGLGLAMGLYKALEKGMIYSAIRVRLGARTILSVCKGYDAVGDCIGNQNRTLRTLGSLANQILLLLGS